MNVFKESRALVQQATLRPLQAVVSIHDVMPETLSRTAWIVDRLQALEVTRVTALVVPGKDWNDRQIDWLKEQQRAGLEIAGHGWLHRAERRFTLWHKLHGLLLSRMAAEHLSLSELEIARLLRHCHRWFVERDFEAPSIYVPPAWAMGGIDRSRLKDLPFRYYETLSGVYRTSDQRFTRLPLAGYEADNWLRVAFLQGWNRLNQLHAMTTAKPLRISIHPRDFSLGLAGQIETQLQRVDRFLSYSQVFEYPHS